MTAKIFGETYSSNYDLFYEKKAYEAECDFIEEILQEYGVKVTTILDMGCGTGGHMIPLIKKGFQLTGVDQSVYMLQQAEKKLKQTHSPYNLVQGDITEILLNDKFHGIISMFAVISYLTANQQLEKLCKTAFNHLNEHGIFIFDTWHGPGVLTDPPTPSLKKYKDGGKEILRFNDTKIDILSHTVNIDFQIWVTEDKKILEKNHESHTIRYFFPQELKYYLEIAGFRQVHFCPFLRLGNPLNISDWHMTTIALR